MKLRSPTKRKLPSFDVDEVSRTKKTPLCGNIKITEAIDQGDILLIKEILENKDLRFSSPCLNAGLLKSVQDGKRRIVQLLLNHGVCVDKRGKTGCLALVAAAEHGYLDIVELLVDKGAPVNGQDSSGKTALMAAVEKSCCHALSRFLYEECKANVDLQDNEGKTVLMLAIDLWDYRTVQMLFLGNVDFAPCDVNIKNKDGLTALDLAKKSGFLEILNVVRQSSQKKMSPLSLAAANNNTDLVRQLLEIHPCCINGFGSDKSPLAAAMHGLQKQWDGKIHCSIEVMVLLLQANVDVDICHDCGLTPLMMAASAGSQTAVQNLLRHGANVNRFGQRRQTALMIAALKGHAGIMHILIHAGAYIRVRDENYKTAMDFAVQNSDRKCTQVLLKSGSPLRWEDLDLLEKYQLLDVLLEVKDSWVRLFIEPELLHTVLCKAIESRSYKLVTALIDYGANVNECATDEEQSNPLILSLKDDTMLRLLLNKGADINIRDSLSGRTALMEAASKGTVGLVHTLLDNNADMYAESEGSTALLLACFSKQNNVLRALLNRGMNIDYVTQNGETALLYALSVEDFALTELLIHHGADVNFAKSDGTTTLMRAIMLNCPSKFLQLLITNGASVNAQDNNGDTALFHALRRGEKKFVSLLVQHGADTNHSNLFQKTPLMLAANNKFCKLIILKILLKRQATVNSQDIHGDTALHMAVKNYDESKVKELIKKGADWRLSNGQSRTALMVAFQQVNDLAIEGLFKAGVKFEGSPSTSQMWLSDVDSKLEKFSVFDSDTVDQFNFVCCLSALLQAGLSLNGVQVPNLNLFLFSCLHEVHDEMIALLLQAGAAPQLLNLSTVPVGFPSIKEEVTVTYGDRSFISPLMMAIESCRQVPIALFAQACFFHDTDLKMLQDARVIEKLKVTLEDWHYKYPCPKEELCPSNWSLRTWSKLAVMKAVGFGQDREERVRALPIPQRLQDELLFKHLSAVKDQLKEPSLSGSDTSLDEIDSIIQDDSDASLDETDNSQLFGQYDSDISLGESD